MSSPHVTVCDINASMLEVGRARADKLGHTRESGVIDWRQGDAMRLPFEDGQFDAYTIAFGIRNVVRIDEARSLLNFVVAPLRMFGFLNFFVSQLQALAEAYRVLRPGGRFLCLEFSRVDNPVVSAAYDFYSFQASNT